MIAGFVIHTEIMICLRRAIPDFTFILQDRAEMKSGIAFFTHQEWSIQAVLLSAFHRLRK